MKFQRQKESVRTPLCDAKSKKPIYLVIFSLLDLPEASLTLNAKSFESLRNVQERCNLTDVFILVVRYTNTVFMRLLGIFI